MDVKNKIGKRLKEVREERGMTQAEVAKVAGIHPNFYARLERDEENVSIENFEKILKALKSKSSDILTF
ncbi:MAG: helix-turn-helix transcriptional regulator [Candidatus Shapirobacteria bacterium]|nr:helix-turn-helix transcriptional regulator [Candidatus Shapirobacteria bacterium]